MPQPPEVLLYRVFKKEHYIDIQNVTVWRVLQKCLHLAYKLSTLNDG
jgi:hypothetical protein